MNKTKPTILIEYCTQCNWLLRAAWYAQELLTTFPDCLGGVTLIPAAGGTFKIQVETKTIWDRAQDGGFPDIKELKQKIRDEVAPNKDLGHTDRHAI